MFRFRSLFLAALCVALIVPPVLAQDEVEGPWGTANGDVFGRARSDVIPELFTGASDVLEAWIFDPFAVGSSRPGGRSSMVFDATGNLYWISVNGRLTSVVPDGSFRWNASDQGIDYIMADGFNTTSPIVGVERIYGLAGPGATPALAAFDKITGELVWEAPLVVATAWTSDNQLTPILYAGKVYVVGESDGAMLEVFQVDAATGTVDWQSPVAVTINFRGTMAIAPGIFAGGDHGLYFNGTSNNGSDGIGEMYGLRIDPDPATGGATLEWQTDAGHCARSHVIYNVDAPSGPRLYTHTWADYGATLYSFDPVTGVSVANVNATNSGHGFYDVGCLDFDDATLVTGGFNAQVVEYLDDGTGATTDTVSQFGNDLTPNGWFGEYRALGQLLMSPDGDSILVSGTNSRVNDLGPEYTARVLVMNVSDALALSEDGPMYLDEIVVEEGPDLGSLSTVFAEDFEGLGPGDLPGQNDWEDDRASPSGDGGPVQVVDDPTGMGQGQVAFFDALGNGGGWQGVFRNFPDTTGDVVVVRYKQYRNDLTENAWVYFGDAVDDFSAAWTLGWDVSLGYFPYHFAGASVAQATELWQEIIFTYENMNDPDPANRLVTVEIDGVTSTTPQDSPFADSIRGFGLQYSGTPPTTGGAVNEAAVEWDTGATADNAFTVRGGPLVGPDGKLYYFDGEQEYLVALEALASADPQFRRGDANGDGTFNALVDGLFILNFGFVPGSPAPPCMDAADTDDSGSFSGLIDGLFTLNFGFIPGSPPPPAPGPTDCGVDPTMDATDCVEYLACP